MMSRVLGLFLIIYDLGTPRPNPLHLWASVSPFVKCGDEKVSITKGPSGFNIL